MGRPRKTPPPPPQKKPARIVSNLLKAGASAWKSPDPEPGRPGRGTRHKDSTATNREVMKHRKGDPPPSDRPQEAASPPTITPAEYLQAFEAYRQEPTIYRVMKAMTWSQSKASKLVLEGWPKWGLIPLRDRLAQFIDETVVASMAEDREVMNEIASEAREIQVGALRLVKQALQAGCVAAFDEEGRVRPKDLKDLWEVFEKAGRFFSFARGGPDQRGELAIPGGILDEASMLANLIGAGVLPAEAVDVTPKQLGKG